MDCFCGSGGTLKAANDLNRKWLGIDKSSVAIRITKERLKKKKEDLFSKETDYNFIKTVKSIANHIK